MAAPSTGDREALRQHFAQIAPDQQVNGWNEMWQKKVTPWDRGTPNPALADAFKDNPKVFGRPFQEGKIGDPRQPPRKRALVPGCGKGYDVFLLTAYGYDAFGLDSSQLAVQGARACVDAKDRDHRYPLRNGLEGRGEAVFVQADFFGDAFLADTDGGQFDLIYDYTFLCALPPALRPKWAKRMSELLAPTGHLVCLEFPLKKEPKMGGPPHGLTGELYEELLSNPGREIGYNHGGYVCPDRSGERADDALERIARWKAERTHAAGQGSDCVSIWRHLRE
ncbi:hypothetical protein LTR08_003034 [Meristemomyces frigidus]|nr:hypothetical protein LTR08_003034 [Meristemomyces frigidus]